jgi:hypothetical protein
VRYFVRKYHPVKLAKNTPFGTRKKSAKPSQLSQRSSGQKDTKL